jgi:NADH:ubiquinone oxidoreductase subunit 3 (subunit A)
MAAFFVCPALLARAKRADALKAAPYRSGAHALGSANFSSNVR